MDHGVRPEELGRLVGEKIGAVTTEASMDIWPDEIDSMTLHFESGLKLRVLSATDLDRGFFYCVFS